VRRGEDKAAAAIVGARTLHFDFLDCVYRRAPDGEWLYSEISVPPHEADTDYPDRIAQAISSRLRPDDRLVCQLALGSHVDHVLVRQAAELLGRPLLYVIDVPYWIYKPGEFEAKAAGMQESAFRITEPSLDRWIEAALAYASQFPVLGEQFNTPEKAAESIRKYREEQGGIRTLQFS
jgi:LmbE family N-acetylglucosaminyl deacetylase